MNFQDHYEALYGQSRSALDAGGMASVPLVHVFSGDDLSGVPYSPPFVIYRQDVERPIGTTGGGASKVLRSSWVFSAYTFGLAEGLGAISLIATGLTASGPKLTTADGYVTTHFAIEGHQSLFDQAANAFASHLRIFWERSC